MATWYAIEHDRAEAGQGAHMLELSTRPGKANQSGEERDEGYLGTTNGHSEFARGTIEADSIAEAVTVAKRRFDLRDWPWGIDPAPMDETGTRLPYSDAWTITEMRCVADRLRREARERRNDGEPGFFGECENSATPGSMVLMFHAASAGIDTGGLRYAVVCDAHLVHDGAATIDEARSKMRAPATFCPLCAEAN